MAHFYRLAEEGGKNVKNTKKKTKKGRDVHHHRFIHYDPRSCLNGCKTDDQLLRRHSEVDPAAFHPSSAHQNRRFEPSKWSVSRRLNAIHDASIAFDRLRQHNTDEGMKKIFIDIHNKTKHKVPFLSLSLFVYNFVGHAGRMIELARFRMAAASSNGQRFSTRLLKIKTAGESRPLIGAAFPFGWTGRRAPLWIIMTLWDDRCGVHYRRKCLDKKTDALNSRGGGGRHRKLTAVGRNNKKGDGGIARTYPT